MISKSSELGIYLTNTLEEAHAMTGLPLFTQWIAEEPMPPATSRRTAPVMVVLGNPPYSVNSMNTGYVEPINSITTKGRYKRSESQSAP